MCRRTGGTDDVFANSRLPPPAQHLPPALRFPVLTPLCIAARVCFKVMRTYLSR
eukprot:gene3235-2142_t